ncbi:hypothetical protein SAMN04487957_10348 [Halomonas shengliensis]|uniref:Uncharacterized protein n=1 Tax=Halomonas shengliensis TaxID=419597 RepID=A0A1H0G392_9GAMM|nr:hypothetical protein [Halomonas shengliensis]SDO01320.1 hypothetical protein SAMN04487957_10348 [Halomonas shengliensis]
MINDGVYKSRPYVVLTRKELGAEILRPENILLSLPESQRKKPHDIGSLCFSQRAVRRSGWNTNREIQALPVIMSSLMVDRREFVARYLDTVAVSGLRDESINTKLVEIVKIFDWLDSNRYSNFLSSEERAEKAYIAYTDYLYHEIQNGRLAVNTAAKRQGMLIHGIIGLMFSDVEYQIKAKTYRIREKKNITQAPSRHDFNEYLSYLVPFIRGLRKALMNDDFPLTINEGKCKMYIFTGNTGYSYSPEIHGEELSSIGIFDLKNGRLLTMNEYVESKVDLRSTTISEKKRRSSLKNEYNRSLKIFQKSNVDKSRAYYRVFWAQKVIRGYAILLQFLTGMNNTPLVNLKYEDALAVGKGSVKKELISIKHRAKGRVEPYPLGGRRGLKILREYLEFRDWLLDGEEYDLLFFSNAETSGKRDMPVPLRSDFQTRFFKQLKGKLFPSYVKNISPMLARKYKSIALEFIGATEEEAADLLNHSLETNRRSYGAPSVDDSSRELSQFWGAVKSSAEKVKLIGSDDGISGVDIAVGHCNDLGNAEEISEGSLIEPNCRTQYGCLYCEHYVCHADDEDIRKLLCLKYVIEEVRGQAVEFEAADQLFQDLCLRVEALLKRMTELYPKMIDSIDVIREEVFELGVLTPFWESRLNRYEEMGVIL